MRLGFATDIHLDVVAYRAGCLQQPDLKRALLQRIGRYIARELDTLVIGGDISIGPEFKDDFEAFCEGAAIPVYFVLGNHDFWDAPEVAVRATASAFPGYLDHIGVVELDPLHALVGRTGWYDTLTGNPLNPKVRVQDWQRAERLVNCWRVPYLLQKECRKWSVEEAEKALPVLETAASTYENVYCVTHFPCFTKACWDEFGRPDVEENGWWPWSINTTFGHMLRDVVSKYPQVQFTLLTGHTHGGGRTQITPNLTCISGRAQYGNPQLAEAWSL